ISFTSLAQTDKDNIFFVVDSIPILKDPPEGLNLIDPDDIDHIEVIKSKDKLDSLGYPNVDGIVYIFTKEYVTRPDSVKNIPTTARMTRKGAQWYFKNTNTPYTGPFIDYYPNGKKQGEGHLHNG